MSEWQLKIEHQIHYIQRHGCKKTWTSVVRRNDELYGDDPITMVKGVGKKATQILQKFNIKKIKDCRNISSNDGLHSQLQSAMSPKHKTALTNILDASRKFKPGSVPVIDYRKFDNPYLAKYGHREWEKKIRIALPKFIPISDLIHHMAVQTSKLMKGTKYEGKGFFVHDALSQLTEKSTIAWMKKNKFERRTYYSMWIKPELGCNDVVGPKKSTAFAHRPVGNSPEFMCLDNSLNKDIHESVKLHVAATFHLPKTDEKKFMIDTPKRIVSAYRRVHDPTYGGNVPSPLRIEQDVGKFIHSLKEVANANGAVVKGLASREGHRRAVEAGAIPRETSMLNHNTNVTKQKSRWLHTDAMTALIEHFDEAEDDATT